MSQSLHVLFVSKTKHLIILFSSLTMRILSHNLCNVNIVRLGYDMIKQKLKLVEIELLSNTSINARQTQTVCKTLSTSTCCLDPRMNRNGWPHVESILEYSCLFGTWRPWTTEWSVTQITPRTQVSNWGDAESTHTTFPCLSSLTEWAPLMSPSHLVKHSRPNHLKLTYFFKNHGGFFNLKS